MWHFLAKEQNTKIASNFLSIYFQTVNKLLLWENYHTVKSDTAFHERKLRINISGTLPQIFSHFNHAEKKIKC